MLRDLSAATLHLLAFLVGSFVWMLVIGVGVAILLMLREPGLLSGSLDIRELDGLTMGLTSAVQIVGLAVLAALLAMVLGERPAADGPRRWWTVPHADQAAARLQQHLALRHSRRAWAVVAALGGLTVWTFPSWLAAWLVEATGIDSVSLEATSRLILEGPTIDRLAMGFAVVVTAPLFEEVIFRGYLWEVSERAIGRWGAFLATTLLFAGYHLDPVHTVSLLPTAAFLGLLRLVSGSLWPGVLAHLANNGIAIVVTLWGTELVSEDEIPLWLAITGTSLTAVVFGMGYAWTRKRPHSGATP